MRARVARAFTLVEVLISLALLLLIGAIISPSLMGLSDRVTIDAACDELSAATSIAAAHATQRAEPLELVAVSKPEGTAIYVRALGGPAREEPASASEEPAVQGDSRPWEIRVTTLRPSVVVSGQDPRPAAREGLSSLAREPIVQSDQPAPSNEADPTPAVRLAIFLPDGSAVIGQRMFVGVQTRTRVGELSPLTSKITFRDAPPVVDEGDAEEGPGSLTEREEHGPLAPEDPDAQSPQERE
ncbi:MAG: prepilin-type N-terminal cleavage/methylation domain-containing protein [Phycisphaerales bacterium]|nr:prepilin-type N-terminal cleavage/methylation domain-containing protein [Phycisphaerales bacterium]